MLSANSKDCSPATLQPSVVLLHAPAVAVPTSGACGAAGAVGAPGRGVVLDGLSLPRREPVRQP